MRAPQTWEWLIILAIVLLLFGAKRLPDAARGLGRSLRILKAETKGLHEDDEQTAPTTPPAALPRSESSTTASSVDLSDAQADPAAPAPAAPERRPAP